MVSNNPTQTKPIIKKLHGFEKIFHLQSNAPHFFLDPANFHPLMIDTVMQGIHMLRWRIMNTRRRYVGGDSPAFDELSSMGIHMLVTTLSL